MHISPPAHDVVLPDFTKRNKSRTMARILYGSLNVGRHRSRKIRDDGCATVNLTRPIDDWVPGANGKRGLPIVDRAQPLSLPSAEPSGRRESKLRIRVSFVSFADGR